MQLRPQLQIQSILKAMTDVVLPAVDANNKLAQEQTRLIMGTLGLMARQLSVQFRFDCDELVRLIEFARELQQLSQGGQETSAANAALASCTESAKAILDRAKAGPDEVEQAVRELRAATGAVVTGVYRDGEAASQGGVQKAVLAVSKEQLLRDRSLLITQGWEPDPKAVPAIETLLGIEVRGSAR